MLRVGWRLIVVSVGLVSTLSGNWDDTSTGIDLDKLPHPPLVRIRSGDLANGSTVSFDNITARAATTNDRQVILRGVGKTGKPWEAHIVSLDQVWRADLDGNGTQDYVIFTLGPYGNGRLTPSFSLSVLLMDRQGMPVPFFTTAYHGEGDAGIKHLVDLDRDGHPELLINTYDENISDAEVQFGCSGHWTTQLYRFKDRGVEEVRGTFGGVSFPFIHRWTYGVAQCASGILTPVQQPSRFEHGTSREGADGTIILKASRETELVPIRPVAGCNAINPAVIVYDRPERREIAFPNLFTQYAAELTNRIRQNGARLELRGIDRWMGNGACSVNLLWAQ
jgi:hypothetical protein